MDVKENFGPLGSPQVGSRRQAKVDPELQELFDLDAKLMGVNDAWDDAIGAAFEEYGVSDLTALYNKDPEAVRDLLRTYHTEIHTESVQSMASKLLNRLFEDHRIEMKPMTLGDRQGFQGAETGPNGEPPLIGEKGEWTIVADRNGVQVFPFPNSDEADDFSTFYHFDVPYSQAVALINSTVAVANSVEDLERAGFTKAG